MTLPFNITIEIRVNGTWIDITNDWRKTTPIQITYGKRDEGTRTDPAACRLQLDNRNGRYSPRNPNSDLFGLIGRNTPLRISLGTVTTQAFPSIVASGTPHTTATNSTTKTIEFPAHSAGDRLFLPMIWQGDTQIVSIDSVDGDEWVEVYNRATSESEARLHVYEIRERLTASAVAGNITVTLSGSEMGAARIYAWQDHDPDTPIEASIGVTGRTDAPNPDQLDPSWGSESTTYIAVCGWSTNTPSVSTFPAGFVGGEQHEANSIAGAGFGIAFREDDAFNIDPGPFQLSAAEQTVASTLAVRPSQIGQPTSRLVTEVTAWPPRWDQSGENRWVPIEGAGILRRLSQGAETIGSVYERHNLGLSGGQFPVAYWPCEDEGERIGRLGSAIDEAQGMKVFLPFPDFASQALFAGSMPLLVMRGGRLIGDVPGVPGGSTNIIQFRFLLGIPDGGLTNNTLIATLRTSGSAFSWQLIQSSNNLFEIRVFNPSGDLVQTFSGRDFGAMGISGRLIYMYLTTDATGTDVDWVWGAINTETGEHRTELGTVSNATAASATSVLFGGGANPLDNVVIGHVSVHAQDVPFDVPKGPGGFTGVSAVTAFRNEPAGRRIRRLADEERVALATIGDLDDTELMGPQNPDTFLNLVQECVDADLGILSENRQTIGLQYQNRVSFYNRPSVFILDRLAGHLARPLEPLPDDQGITNDIILRRKQGGSVRLRKTDGSLSIANIGRYQDSKTVNVVDVERLASQASWRLHVATVDETRFPAIVTNLALPGIRDDVALQAAILRATLGDVFNVINPSEGLPPDDIAQQIQGYEEIIDFNRHEIAFVTLPASPWQVAVYDVDRYDTAGSETTASFVSGTDTSLSVAILVGQLWTTDSAEFPFDILVSGVRLEVTAITGSVSPQTFTVTQAPVNGVVKTIPVGSAVGLAKPAIRAL